MENTPADSCCSAESESVKDARGVRYGSIQAYCKLTSTVHVFHSCSWLLCGPAMVLRKCKKEA